METASYIERKTFVKYDDSHYLLYLNEEAADVVTDEESGATVPGYKYSGTEADGSVKIEAQGVTDGNRRSKFISGLIGLEFDMDAQVAILANNGDTAEHTEELERFRACRAECKASVDNLLARTF